jgi:streptogramin lyase
MRHTGGSFRAASIALAVSAIVFVTVIGVHNASAAAGRAEIGGPLAGNPLIIPNADVLMAGQETAADVAMHANPQAAAEREGSRSAYARLSSLQARRLLDRTFASLIKRPANGMPEVPSGGRIVGYPSFNSVQLALPGHQLGVAESTWPVATRVSGGRYAPIDLALTASGSGYAPVRSAVDVRIPRNLATGIKTPGNGVSLTPVDEHNGVLANTGTVDRATVVYTNTQQAADTVVKPTPTGFQVEDILRSAASPGCLAFRVSAPAHAVLKQDPSGVVRVTSHGASLATILPPGAVDAAGTPVPVTMEVAGNKVVVHVAHRSGSYLYPVAVDPEINDNQLATTSGGKRAGWEFKSSNEARFGHKAIYEGPGKEHLETTGVAEYVATEFGYWAYETKGNSKIYEAKTKTSAKNKGAKIESFLEIRDPGGAEKAKKILSTESEEPEYAEKVSTICAWNASKVEECLPAAGKEKNVVRFQQAATAAPGASYKFSDTLNEGTVSISEPSGEHSTTSFNTTSSEVEGEVEVEGKKVLQKRVNALYGAGAWLTKSAGALQFIAKDPGIGVAATRLEYEKSAGSWEQLSAHNYLESENACQGVQCYAEHTEYWTVDPKLPDGEDKIRYRAEEAIAGTVSLTSETESAKTVKVDTKAPHQIVLGGLPYGDELTEKPYKVVVEASDGEGSTVASSGVKSIALFVSGHEIAEAGHQTGCSIAAGECRASAEWKINGAELGAGHHAIVVVATDKAGNEARVEKTISIRHSTPVALGPGSVDLQSGDFALSGGDVSMGSGLTVSRNYSSRATESGLEGPLGPQWNLDLGPTESLVEMVDGGVLLTDAKGAQAIFASLGGGEFEPPTGDSNLKLTLEENKTTKEKLAYYLEDATKHTKTKFTLPSGGTKVWAPTRQEGAVATDTVSYAYRTVEQVNEFAVPTGSLPLGITRGADGNIWFTNSSTHKVGKMLPSGAYTEYASPSGGELGGITEGPDGNVWYLDANFDEIGKITPAGAITQYELGSGNASYIASGTDGNLWFTASSGKIGKVTTAGAVTEYSLSAGRSPGHITAGPDGNMWFTIKECSIKFVGCIGRITPSGGVAEYNLPAGVPLGIASGPDGNLWFTSYNSPSSAKIGKITTAGTITAEYTLPSYSYPVEITPGPDGKMWFSNYESDKIGKVTMSGAVTEYALASEGKPRGIATGPDGNIWFTEEKTTEPKFSRIGMMTTSGKITEPTEALAPVPAGVSCSPMKAGCRALKFTYASSTTATGENSSEWGEFKNRLTKVLMNAYNPVSKAMQETAVAEYSYDKLGRLRAEWDPRVSPALKTTYGYDLEGHVTAVSPPGQEPWTLTYGSIEGDAGSGRLLKASRAPASESLWGGTMPASTEAPVLTGTPLVGVRMSVSNGKWSGSPVTFSYRWQDCDASGKACSPIVGAINQNYTPAVKDEGHKLVVLVTATNAGGSVIAPSTASATVEVREFSEYSVPAGSNPSDIASGPDGNLWFTDLTSGKVGKIAIDGTIAEYTTLNKEPEGIVGGPDKNVWFVEHAIKHVARMTPTGSLTEYTLTRSNTYNVGIAAGADGNLWFTESKAKYVGKINTSGEVQGEYLLSATGSEPYGIALGPDNNLWVADKGANKIEKVTTAGAVTEYALPAGSQPYGIAAGPDGNLWFTDNGTNKVGKITTAGVVTEYALPASSAPRGITSFAGGLWVAEYGTSKVAKVTTAGAVTEYALPTGSQPNDVSSGPDNFLWLTNYGTDKILRFNPNRTEAGIVEGEAKTPSAGFTMEYGVPLSGSGLPSMTSSEVSKWGQIDEPDEATAVMPPDAAQGWPAADYKRATVYYLDEQGREVNVSQPSTASHGSVSTTEYNEYNDVVRALSADNRQAALEAGSESVDVAKNLSTYFSYRDECSSEAESKHEAESLYPGARLCDTEGPQHQIKYVVGGEQRESLARLHTKYFYDENSPAGETYNLQTKTTTLAALANEEEVEVRKTTTSYSGQSNLGWALRAPTSVTVDPEGKKLTTTTLYDSSTAQITETRAPAGGGGGSAHDTKLVYYSAEANTEGYSACGGHPEWAGLLCESLPAKQPESGGLPQLPVTTATYNVWNEPLVVTETFGSTVRTKTKTYDEAGRLASSETTSTANTALPKVTNEYDTKTGLLEKQSITVEGKTKTITSTYNALGQPTEYTDADGNIAKYRYAGASNDYLLEELTDGSNSGTGKQTYTYNATTKQREELWDSAAGTFSASYDTEGNLASVVYPNAMCADYTRNSIGEATQIEYIKTTNCSEHSASVWFSESRAPSVRGETLSRANTLAGDTYVYDTVGRLTEAHETPAGEGCTTRLYAYDEESNRTSQTTRAPGGGGACATEGGTVLSHTYDEGNRLTDSGIAYDSFGNVTKLPASDAEGHELSSTFYVDNAVATQAQNGVTNNYYLDPEGRVRETVSGANAIVTHYDGSGEAVSWTSETGGKSTRNIPGIDGTLSATQTNGGTPVLQLHDLQGDVVATAALATGETKVLSTYNSTEFGVPNKGVAPPKYAWLGATDVATAFSSGVITYGSTSYVPQIGRALQSEAVEPPGAPQGSGAGAAYTSQAEPWVFQGAAAAAAEAPGLEAARERAAAEAAASAVDPPVESRMNRKKAIELGETYWEAESIAVVLSMFDLPADFVELLGKVAGEFVSQIDDAFAWLHDAGEKLVKCGKNKWSNKLNICRFEYDQDELKLEVNILGVGIGHTFKWPNFSVEPRVEECKYGVAAMLFCSHNVGITDKEL